MFRLLVVLIIMCWIAPLALAQDPCILFLQDSVRCEPGTTCPPVRGCVSYRLEFDNCSIETAVNYNRDTLTDPDDYKGVSTVPGVYTYDLAGTYVFGQFLSKVDTNGNTNPEFVYRTIIVSDTLPPAVTLQPCANREVRLVINDTIYERFSVDYGDGSALDTLENGIHSYTYPAETAYTVKINGFSTENNCIGTNILTVRPFDVLPPPAVQTIQTIDQNMLSVTFETQENLFYVINTEPVGQAAFSDTITGTGSIQTTTINGINVSAPVTVRISTIDACGNVTNGLRICPLVWTNSKVLESANELSWQGGPCCTPSPETFTLIRNGEVYQNLPLVCDTFLTDTNVVCQTEYCYVLEATAKNPDNSTATIRSQEVCLTARSQRPPTTPQGLFATVSDDNQININWLATNENLKEYILFNREAAGNRFQEIARIDAGTTEYADEEADVETGQNCYYLQAVDICENVSINNDTVCVALLNVETNPIGGTGNLLTWQPYQNGKPIESQQIEWIDQNGTVYRTQNVARNARSYIDSDRNLEQQIICYRIATAPDAASQAADKVSYSNTVCLQPEDNRLRLPDAFSPNGDGMNDVLLAYGQFITQFDMIVYNQWGSAVFRVTGY